MHESQRVYGDKLTDEKDADAFMKIQIDIVKKSFDVSKSIPWKSTLHWCTKIQKHFVYIFAVVNIFAAWLNVN